MPRLRFAAPRLGMESGRLYDSRDSIRWAEVVGTIQSWVTGGIRLMPSRALRSPLVYGPVDRLSHAGRMT